MRYPVTQYVTAIISTMNGKNAAAMANSRPENVGISTTIASTSMTAPQM